MLVPPDTSPTEICLQHPEPSPGHRLPSCLNEKQSGVQVPAWGYPTRGMNLVYKVRVQITILEHSDEPGLHCERKGSSHSDRCSPLASALNQVCRDCLHFDPAERRAAATVIHRNGSSLAPGGAISSAIPRQDFSASGLNLLPLEWLPQVASPTALMQLALAQSMLWPFLEDAVCLPFLPCAVERAPWKRAE